MHNWGKTAGPEPTINGNWEVRGRSLHDVGCATRNFQASRRPTVKVTEGNIS